MKRYGIYSKRVLTEENLREAVVVIDNGKIAEVNFGKSHFHELKVIDFGEDVIMPGLIDPHVHINEPGRTEWEGFDTATRTAAAGGITSLIEMPLNSSPVTTTVEALKEKIAVAREKIHVNCGFYGGIVPGNLDRLEELTGAGVWGIKAFLTHSGIEDFPNVEEAHLRRGMPIIARTGLPLLVHAELSTDNEGQKQLKAHPTLYKSWLASRPKSWENRAIELMTGLCREYKCRTHIVHLSSAEAIPVLVAAKEEGLPVTVEICPHYLFFNAESISDKDTRYKCAPPIREKKNNDKLWEAVKNGLIDFIASDHSPSTPELKALDTGSFAEAWGGIAGLQFLLPAFWTEACKRGFGITDVARLLSKNATEFLGLERKGEIKKGYDADILVWNPEKQFTVTEDIIYHRHKITPYSNQKLYGTTTCTIANGEIVYRKGLDETADEPPAMGGEFENLGKGKVLLRA